MAKPTKYATPICIALTALSIIGIILGLVYQQVMIPIVLLIPTTIYEVYRTEGKSTKAAAWGMLALLVAELIFVFFNIDFNLTEFLGRSTTHIRGYRVPLGNIQVISPTLMAVLSIVLITNTRGRYTRWLAAIILVNAFVIIYTIDPIVFQDLIKLAMDEGLKKL